MPTVTELVQKFNEWETDAKGAPPERRPSKTELKVMGVKKDLECSPSPMMPAPEAEGSSDESSDDDDMDYEGSSDDESSSDSESGSEEEAPKEDAPKEETPEKEEAAKATDKPSDKPEQDVQEAECKKFTMSASEIAKASKKLSIPERHIQVYSSGIAAYAFVKANSGMLKPVRLYFNPLDGKLYIVRRKNDKLHSLFVHMDFFTEINCKSDSLDYLSKGSTDEKLVGVVQSLSEMPHMALWMCDEFEAGVGTGHSLTGWTAKLRRKTAEKKPEVGAGQKRSLVFVFEDPKVRDILSRLFTASAAQFKNKNLATKLAADFSLSD